MKTMAGPMTRLSIYVSIACFTALMKDFSTYENFSDISQVTWLLIFLNMCLQGLVAWRAYIDGSYSETLHEIEETNKITNSKDKLLND
jgi:hypothetical protein